MKKSKVEPFYFEAGKRAVLLLHGFTGSSADIRMLGRYLEKMGYSSHAPHYRGHGEAPEKLLETNPKQWWEDVVSGYQFLKNKGYEEIAVAGLSLGGVFSLKLALNFPVKGIVTMCAPMTMRTTDIMFEGVLEYAHQYKKYEGKSEQEIELELAAMRDRGMPSLPELQQLIKDVRAEIDLLYAPIFVVQATNDRVIDPQSANTIYNTVESPDKRIQWFENSGHVITLGREKDQLHEAVYAFLQSLDWQTEA